MIEKIKVKEVKKIEIEKIVKDREVEVAGTNKWKCACESVRESVYVCVHERESVCVRVKECVWESEWYWCQMINVSILFSIHLPLIT